MGHWAAVNNISWSMANESILAKLLKGFDNSRPPRSRPRKPLCIEIVRRFVAFVNIKSYVGTLHYVMVLTAYWFALRVGEYAWGSKYTSHHILKGRDLTFTFNPDNSDIVQATLNVRHHKGDPRGRRDAHVPVRCICSAEGRPVDVFHCPVHALIRFVGMRAAEGFSDDDPLFVCEERRTQLLASHVNNLIRGWVLLLDLDPADYSAHCLRSGRATDLARGKIPAYLIKKFCRWLSDCWEEHYLKLDFSDLAKVTGVSLEKLNLSLSSSHLIASAAANNKEEPLQCDHCQTQRDNLHKMVREEVARKLKAQLSASLHSKPLVAALPAMQAPPMVAMPTNMFDVMSQTAPPTVTSELSLPTNASLWDSVSVTAPPIFPAASNSVDGSQRNGDFGMLPDSVSVPRSELSGNRFFRPSSPTTNSRPIGPRNAARMSATTLALPSLTAIPRADSHRVLRNRVVPAMDIWPRRQHSNSTEMVNDSHSIRTTASSVAPKKRRRVNRRRKTGSGYLQGDWVDDDETEMDEERSSGYPEWVPSTMGDTRR